MAQNGAKKIVSCIIIIIIIIIIILFNENPYSFVYSVELTTFVELIREDIF